MADQPIPTPPTEPGPTWEAVVLWMRQGKYDRVRSALRYKNTAHLWTRRRDAMRLVELITDEIEGRKGAEHAPEEVTPSWLRELTTRRETSKLMPGT